MTIDNIVESDGTVSINILQGGRHAVLLYKGPCAELHKCYDWLYGQWLPSSEEETANRPPFQIYLNDPKNTSPADLMLIKTIPQRIAFAAGLFLLSNI